MWGTLFGGLTSLFDKLIQVVIKVRCRIVCCSKNMDNVTVPNKKTNIN